MKFHLFHNEKGILLPAAIVLLFVISGLLLIFVDAFITQMGIYEMLESRYISATIVQMENQE
jgi:competence protein ComGC